jgi:hypothetical protein
MGIWVVAPSGIYAPDAVRSSMASALVWSSESVLLGLWALVFSTYSTPLHVFVARSHLLISSFTFVLHLYVKSRGLVIGSAISHAFVCAVSALFLVYLSLIFAEGSMSRLFKMPSVGWLTLDACIGLAWFVVAIISSIGMALSYLNGGSTGSSVKCPLMFHSYGIHLVFFLPCLSILIDLGGLYEILLCIIFVSVWVLYIFWLGVRIFIGSGPFQEGGVDFWALTAAQKFLYIFLEICVKLCLIWVSAISLLTPTITFEQRSLVFCLLAVSIVVMLDILYVPYFILGRFFNISKMPTLDTFFGREWERDHNEDIVGPSAPTCFHCVDPHSAPSAPPKCLLVDQSARPAQSIFTQRTSQLESSRLYLDPAAVSISRRHLVPDVRAKHF